MSEKSRVWQAVRKETRKLQRLLERAPEGRRTALKPVTENVGWMRVQLDLAREYIAEEDIVVEYDNGGGQSGLRENPAFKAYENLWKCYLAGLEKILAELPDAAKKPEEELEPENVLDIIKARRRAQS